MLKSTIFDSVKGGIGAKRRWYTAAAACLLFGAGVVYAQTQKAVQEPPGILTFRLALKRIEPASVTVPAGRYQVRLINGIVVNAAVSFRLDREGGARLSSSQVAKGASRAVSEVELAAGKYILEAGGRREWRAEIVVTSPSSK